MGLESKDEILSFKSLPEIGSHIASHCPQLKATDLISDFFID